MKTEDIVSHYEDSGSCNVAWLREMIRQETEGEVPDEQQGGKEIERRSQD